jgi:hypothetical protein
MNDEIRRSMYIAQDEIRRTARIEREKNIQREHRPLTIVHIVLIGVYLGLYAFILLQIIKGCNVDLKTATNFFNKYLK